MVDGIFPLGSNDTVWLTQQQMASLFQRERLVITKHIRNAFKEGELDEKSNVQNLHIAGSDKPVRFFNLDVVISVGYRVKSKRGTQFRIWATQVVRDHLLKGYSVNQRQLADLKQTVRLVATMANRLLTLPKVLAGSWCFIGRRMGWFASKSNSPRIRFG